MSFDREADWLADIIGYADDAIDYMGTMTLGDFMFDHKTIDAVERCIERVAEAAVRIGEPRFSELTGGLPLAPIRGMGNALRHAYDRIDVGTTFATVRDDLPPLRDACAVALTRRKPHA
jgi:uncharacterized protein with HEPN domain